MTAIEEEVIGKVLGQGKDYDDLWIGFTSVAPIFAHLVNALFAIYVKEDQEPTKQVVPHELVRRVADDMLKVFQDLSEEDAAELSSVSFHHWTRNVNTIERLRSQDCFDDFVKTDAGSEWCGASLGCLWGLFALKFVANWPEVFSEQAFSEQDRVFALYMFRAGARDSAAFIRGYELSLSEEREEEPTDGEPMPAVIAMLEADAQAESDAALKALEG